MTGDINRIKQDLATMEQAIGNTAHYGPQHVGWGLGLGIAGAITLTLAAFTDILDTMPVRLFLIPLYLVFPVFTAWLFSEKPFQISTLLVTGPSKSGSNRLAVFIGLAIVGFAFFLEWAGATIMLRTAVALMLSAVYLVTLAWGHRQHSYLLLIAATFFAMAIAFPLIRPSHFDQVFGVGIAIAGFGSALMLHLQINKRDPDVSTH